MIKSQANVQLRAADFHSQYCDAIRIQLRKDLTTYVSLKYGHVLDLWVDDAFISDKPSLQTHDGTAIFKVQFIAYVDQVVQNEVVLGYLEKVTREEDQYHLVFRVGSRHVEAYVRGKLYEPISEGDYEQLRISEDLIEQYKSRDIPIPQGVIQLLKIREFYRVRIDAMNSCWLVGLPQELDDDDRYNSEDGDNGGQYQWRDDENEDDKEDFDQSAGF